MLKVDIPHFSYSEREILQNILFKMETGEHLFILGESGCGKSTLLHLIYGLMDLAEGSILWNNNALFGPSQNLIPGHSFMKLVAQEFELMPFTTVGDNVATHLSRVDLDDDQKRVDELLSVVDLNELKEQKVQFLSGGQKQRTALAKALAIAPEMLLLDEPFSNIDTFRKNTLRRNLFQYLKTNKISCITATHDSYEALSFADRIIILKEGKILAIDTPQKIYNSISSEYVAGFFEETTKLPENILQEWSCSPDKLFFPYEFAISTEATNLKVEVKKSYFRGSHYLILSEFESTMVFFNSDQKLNEGAQIYLTWKNNS